MERHDDELVGFEEGGALPLPATDEQGWVEHDGVKLWYAAYGEGQPVILLHGGLGHGGNWGYQVPALLADGYRPIVIDSRGHGRSTRDERPFSYELMAADVLAVMDALGLARAALVGWSDGADTALILADHAPGRVAGVFFFACNMDPSGAKEFELTPVVGRCFNRHVQDYAQLSATPDQFESFSEAVGLMQRTQPNYAAADLARIAVPVTVVHAEHDEFIKREHAAYLARTIPGAQLVELPGVSHFAPLQQPALFNQVLLAFLQRTWPASTRPTAERPTSANTSAHEEQKGLLMTNSPTATPEERYGTVVAALADAPDVTIPQEIPRARKFGASPELRVKNKIFAMLYKGTLVVKLPRQRVDALIASGDGARFMAGQGRVMKEWVALEPAAPLDWVALAREALAFVGAK